MHGLKTINQLNTLAAVNTPGAALKAIEEANARRAGHSPLEESYEELRQKREEHRRRTVEALASGPTEELIAAVNNNGCPTILEEALALKLQRLSQAATICDPSCIED